MQEFNQMQQSLEKGKLKIGQIEEIKKLFQTALADGRLSTKEVAQIQIYYYESELSEKEFAGLKVSVFQDVVQAAIADRHVTEEEESAILRIAKQLGISFEWIEWAQKEIQKYSSPSTNSRQS